MRTSSSAPCRRLNVVAADFAEFLCQTAHFDRCLWKHNSFFCLLGIKNNKLTTNINEKFNLQTNNLDQQNIRNFDDKLFDD